MEVGRSTLVISRSDSAALPSIGIMAVDMAVDMMDLSPPIAVNPTQHFSWNTPPVHTKSTPTSTRSSSAPFRCMLQPSPPQSAEHNTDFEILSPSPSVQLEQGDLVDLYVPRKCAATGRIIEAKDHASVQIAVADVDSNGRMIPGQSTIFPLSGFVRQLGEGDDSLNRLAQKEGRKYSHISMQQ